jgi:hypothetical protein
LVVSLVPASGLPAEATVSPLPVITRARAEASEGRLFLEGKNFGSSPRVLLGAPAGAFDELVLFSSTPELIEAELPAVEPGTSSCGAGTPEYAAERSPTRGRPVVVRRAGV